MPKSAGPVSIKIKPQVVGDPEITVWHVEVSTPDATHGEETFATEELLRAYLRGLRHGCSVYGVYLPDPEIPRTGTG